MVERCGEMSKELKEFRETVGSFLKAFLSDYQKERKNWKEEIARRAD